MESWNNKFSGVVGHSNPTIWNFLAAVRVEQSSTDGKLTSYLVGQQPPKRKKANEEKDASVRHIVDRNDGYEDRLIEYLDLLRCAM